MIKKETKQKIFKLIFNIINFIFAWLIIALAFISIFNKELIFKILEWLEELVQYIWDWNFLVAFSSSLIETFPVLGVLIPGQNVILLVAIFFAKTSTFNLIWIYIVAIVWAIIWNYLWYILGKHYWDSFFKKYWLWFWLGLTEVKYLKKWINKWGPIGITFAKFHNVTRAFLPFIAWSMGMKKTSFMIYNVIGSVLRAITMVTLWVIFGKHYEVIISNFWKIVTIIMLWLIAYLYFFKRDFIKQYIKDKSEELDKM